MSVGVHHLTLKELSRACYCTFWGERKKGNAHILQNSSLDRDLEMYHWSICSIMFLLARGSPGRTDTTHCNAHQDCLASWSEEQQWHYLLSLCIPVFGVKVAVCPWGLQKLGSDPVLWSLRLPSPFLFFKCACEKTGPKRDKKKLLCGLLPIAYKPHLEKGTKRALPEKVWDRFMLSLLWRMQQILPLDSR